MRSSPSQLLWCYAVLVAAASRLHGHTTDAAAFARQPFDVLVVGGGTAGLVVANRLSEKSSLNIGVIEAGDIHLQEPLIDTPINVGSAVGNPNFDWAFVTAPQTNAVNNKIPIPRGKLLGGSSGLNFILFHRASKAEYDSWSHILGGANSWNWSGLLPFFKKTETLTPGPGGVFPKLPNAPGTDNRFEGRNGAIHASFNNFYTDFERPYVQSLLNLGVPVNGDPDDGDATGTFNSPRSVDVNTGNRSYALKGYFLPAQARANLLVLTGAQASQILFDSPSNKSKKVRANGVKFVSGGKTFTASAAREVVLSAGSIKTPQLLELSGIGNKTLLKSLNLPILIDLPFVGENLQDHLAIASTFLVKNNSLLTTDRRTTNITFREEQLQLYLNQHRGVFTYTDAALSFNSLQKTFNKAIVANMIASVEKDLRALHISPFHRAQAEMQLRLLKEGRVAQTELILNGGNSGVIPATPFPNDIQILAFGSRPFSRGSVHINTTDPLASPVIDPNFLQFEFDRQVMIEMLNFVRKIASTEPLVSLLEGPLNPPANTTDFEPFFLQNMRTEFHPIGTASLGPQGKGGVVDKNLIVYGTSNLRVVDASIMPIHIAAHTQSTTYAIAEKASDIIKGSIRREF